jgi:lipopolysaccharide export system protein LptA
MNPIAKYLFALSAMIVAWTAYAKIAVPFLEGPPSVIARQQSSVEYPDNREPIDKSHLPSMVPTDAWELGSCKTLLTPQGTIYFEYWEPVDNKGTYKLMPFTIVMNDPVNSIRSETIVDPEGKKPAPIALRSLDGARLKLSKPLTAQTMKGGIELESALLDGQVTLFRPPNPQNEEDELRIVTRDIQINQTQIFTLGDVHFSFGPHHGSGRNLSIQLTHKTDAGSPTKNFSNIDGIEQMELAYVSELVLQPVNGSSFPSATGTGESTTPVNQTLSLSNQKTPVRLSCDGPFVFRMADKKAWFRDNVKVTQLDRFEDQLQSDSLQIELAKDSSQTSSIQNLIAVGSPDNPATITSRSQQTLVVGEELIFDVSQSIVKAAGSKPVTIQSPTFAIEAPGLEYHLEENGKLGDFTAEGPGSLRGVKQVGQQPFEVKWHRRLVTESIDAERVRINVSENAFVKFDHQNSIAADDLSLVVWQLPKAKLETKKASWEYRPSTLEAHGNVKLRTEELDGSTRDLFVNWPKPAARDFSPGMESLQHTVSYRGTFARPLQHPDDIRPIPPQDPHLKFVGDKVVANVTGDLNRMQIQDLVVDGSLFVESTARNRRPFAFSGKSMKLVPQSEKLYRVTIDGSQDQLAQFRTDGFELDGANLQVDQQANTIWVHGMGALNIDPEKGSYGPNDGGLPKLESANVTWKGGMVFDGSKIYFEHLVDLVADRPSPEPGQKSKIKASCEGLTLEMTEPIRFEEIDSGERKQVGKKQPSIKRMIFVNQVDQTKRAFQMASWQKNPNETIGFQNATLDANGNVIEAQQLFVPMATFDATSGGIATTGPGQALSYQYSKAGQLSGISPGQTQTSSTPQKPELTCVHIRFDGQLNANSQKGVMEMERNTRTAWAKVKRFDQTLDPDRPANLPLGAAVLKADSLKFARWTPRNSPTRQEMQAEGNTSIQSELFEAVADRLTYSDDTDLLVIEGRPPADAKLSYRRSAKSQPETLRAAKVMYRLSDQWTDVSDVRSVEAGLSRQK